MAWSTHSDIDHRTEREGEDHQNTAIHAKNSWTLRVRDWLPASLYSHAFAFVSSRPNSHVQIIIRSVCVCVYVWLLVVCRHYIKKNCVAPSGERVAGGMSGSTPNMTAKNIASHIQKFNGLCEYSLNSNLEEANKKTKKWKRKIRSPGIRRACVCVGGWERKFAEITLSHYIHSCAAQRINVCICTYICGERKCVRLCVSRENENRMDRSLVERIFFCPSPLIWLINWIWQHLMDLMDFSIHTRFSLSFIRFIVYE